MKKTNVYSQNLLPKPNSTRNNAKRRDFATKKGENVKKTARRLAKIGKSNARGPIAVRGAEVEQRNEKAITPKFLRNPRLIGQVEDGLTTQTRTNPERNRETRKRTKKNNLWGYHEEL